MGWRDRRRLLQLSALARLDAIGVPADARAGQTATRRRSSAFTAAHFLAVLRSCLPTQAHVYHLVYPIIIGW